MSYKMWIYHKEEKPKVIDSDHFGKKEYKEWHDSPAKCEGFTKIPKIKKAIDDAIITGISHGFSKKKAKAIAVHQTGEKVQNISDSINDDLNNKAHIKKAKRKLEKKIKDEFSIDVDLRQYPNFKGIRELEEYYSELKNGNS